MTGDPWADQQEQHNSETRQEAYGSGQSRLFGGEGGAPSLFNKTHAVGTKRTGIITKAPYDQQRTKLGSGEPLFWGQGKGQPPTTDAIDAATGQRNRPVMDTVIELDTEYTMDASEAARLGREEAYEGGERRVFVGREIKPFKDAIKDAVKRGVQLTCDEDMVGKRLTVERSREERNPHGGDTIKHHTFRIDNA